jgi:hypothetical protein
MALEWQPIETAPMDDTQVFIGSAGWIAIAHFWDDRWWSYPVSGMRPEDPSLGHARKAHPTHWMPLPELPDA